MIEDKNNKWDRSGLAKALLTKRPVFAVFDGECLSLYVYREQKMVPLVWGCKYREAWPGSNQTMNARFTVCLLVGWPDSVWQAFKVQVLNYP